MKKYNESDVVNLLALMRTLNVDSLDRVVKTEDSFDIKVGEFLEDDNPGPQELLEQEDAKQLLLKAISELPPNQAAVISMRYGLDSGVSKTLEEIGNKYGVTRERIRQVETKALENLKWLIIHKYKLKPEDLIS